jgi:hypothetical protein
MNAVTDILANAGLPSEKSSENHKPPSNRGVRLGVELILLGILLAPLCLGVSFALDAGFPLFAPLTVFLAGVLWLVYSLIFKEGPIALDWHNRQSQSELNDARAPLLTSPHTLNDSSSRAATTGEMYAPPAITDHTTHLLD